GATATVSAPASSSDLKVKGGSTAQISATNSAASYTFDIKFVNGDVKLVGSNGTTFNGAQTLVIANAKSVNVQPGNCNDLVRVTGQGADVSLAMGAGQNDVKIHDFSGGKVQVSS